MEETTYEANFSETPEFTLFRAIVAENIGYVPQIRFDGSSLAGHRVRIYSDPAGVDVHYSQRSLARYIELTDFFLGAKERNSTELLAAGLLVLRGSDALRQNKGQGLALMACGFQKTTTLLHGLGFKEIVKRQLTPRESGSRAEVLRLINLFLPLAHEIGHVPEAQALGPQVLQSEDISETYRINYERISLFTGEFDYASAMRDPQSFLYLPTLREEMVSDYFAVGCLCWLIARLGRTGEHFQLDELVTGLLLFPLLMGLQAVCLGVGRSWRAIQEITLAMHCRYSIMVDTIRCLLKGLFGERDDRVAVFAMIDDSINRAHQQFVAWYDMSWRAIASFAKEAESVANMDEAAVVACTRQIKSSMERCHAMAEYLDVVSADLEGFSVNSHHANQLRTYGSYLRSYNTLIVDEEGFLRRALF